MSEPSTSSPAPAEDAGRTALLASLETHNATFTQLLSYIPQRYYVAPTQDELDSKWMKNKKRKTGEEIKEHKRRTRVDKLDPSNLANDINTSGSATAETAQDDNPNLLPPALPAKRWTALPPAASIQDLRDRMRFKLDSFRRDRGAGAEAELDPQSRDALVAARRARRGEIRDNRRKERKEERKKAREEERNKAKGAKTQLIVPDHRSAAADSISFTPVALPGASGKRGTAVKKLSNPTQALASLEAHRAKLASMPAEKRKEIEERERWAIAEERAQGNKVGDDERVLKKAVKRDEKRKYKSGKEWADRKKSLDKAQAAAIKKRQDNLQARADSRKKGGKGGSAKAKNAVKGGKAKGRPGFEGGKKKGGPKKDDKKRG